MTACNALFVVLAGSLCFIIGTVLVMMYQLRK